MTAKKSGNRANAEGAHTLLPLSVSHISILSHRHCFILRCRVGSRDKGRAVDSFPDKTEERERRPGEDDFRPSSSSSARCCSRTLSTNSERSLLFSLAFSLAFFPAPSLSLSFLFFYFLFVRSFLVLFSTLCFLHVHSCCLLSGPC